MGLVKGHGPRPAKPQPVVRFGAIDLKVLIGFMHDVAKSEAGGREVDVVPLDADMEALELKELRHEVVRFGDGPEFLCHDTVSWWPSNVILCAVV